jgi:hypothetical protein
MDCEKSEESKVQDRDKEQGVEVECSKVKRFVAICVVDGMADPYSCSLDKLALQHLTQVKLKQKLASAP